VDLATPLRQVRGIGPVKARALADAGYHTVSDLLFHLPHRYEDRREVATVAAIAVGGSCTLRGRLTGMRRIHTRRRGLSVVRGVLEDATGKIPVVWFNRPYLSQQAPGEEEWLLHGPVRQGAAGPELLNPSCERAADAVHGARIVPVYPAAGPLGPAALRRIFDEVLAGTDLPRQVPEPLPEGLLAERGLPALGEALRSLHQPEPDGEVEALNRRRSPAHLRLVFGELLELQLALALLRAREVAAPRTLHYRIDDRLRQTVRELLPFKLTAAQKRVLREVVDDLRGSHPMLRLLQGDVGSGKTIVAALALAVALENGYQGAFMAPTELLAEQHFANLQRLLGHRYRLGLFTAASREPGRLRALASGEIQLAVGTHALIQEGTAFRRLGLAVVDEQHRFGVLQRGLLREKGERPDMLPDMLIMTATPIPRSLALAAYGDLPVSTLDELPPGRTPVATEVVPASRRRQVYKVLREDLAAGARAYVVFPLIEESGQVAAASVAEMGEKVRGFLAGIPCAVLHGRVPAAERERTMRAFASGEVQVLIATTVIEVGVDVPEATWMVIESAERFGLSQLHQLRGRVGRGERPSRCVAVHGELSETAERRLAVFRETTDGFRIAAEDLAIRGPGDVLGTRQAGLPRLRLADPVEHWDWLEAARDAARGLLPRLEEPELEPLLRRVAPVVPDRREGLGGG
jgi:ATP-dependent DNA helicase RecG